eukprot:m.562 g.562  ORF g.562 m.562 type:complete len:148 (-) comp129_c0_seq1:216-659(-)
MSTHESMGSRSEPSDTTARPASPSSPTPRRSPRAPVWSAAHERFSRNVALFANCYTSGIDPTAVGASEGARSGWSARHLGPVAGRHACSSDDHAASTGTGSSTRRRLMWGSPAAHVSELSTSTASIGVRRLFSDPVDIAARPDWRCL